MGKKKDNITAVGIVKSQLELNLFSWLLLCSPVQQFPQET